jgi:hypothetical protein
MGPREQYNKMNASCRDLIDEALRRWTMFGSHEVADCTQDTPGRSYGHGSTQGLCILP